MKPDNREYIAPSPEEHGKIVEYLYSENIYQYIDCEIQDADARDRVNNLFRVLLDQKHSSFRDTQDILARKKGERYHSLVSNSIDTVNCILAAFSHKHNINPPIQLYFRHINNRGESKRCNCHLACSQTEQIEYRTKKGIRLDRYSINIVPFEMACCPLTPKQIFCRKLKEKAEDHLRKKLHDQPLNDYMPLKLQSGSYKDNCDRNLLESEDDQYDHNRTWKDIDTKELWNPEGIYILSSDTGSGKTTFLRHLQLEIIEKTDLIPLFFDADMMEQVKLYAHNEALSFKSIAELFTGYLEGTDEYEFLKSYSKDLVFLIDGLDQISSSKINHVRLIDGLKAVLKGKVVVSSRPYAVVEFETDEKLKFLRLKSFDENDKNIYFSDKYARAKEMCKNCLEMLSVPMLAYMVRDLIENGNDDKIATRKDLYKRFVDYIFEEYENYYFERYHHCKTLEMRHVLGEISFLAIAREEPFLQTIPLTFVLCEGYNQFDDILDAGLVQMILSRNDGIEKFFHFSHQSFQEYLAAEYIFRNRNKSHFKQVLKEKWNPKWKEVIKFLAGLNGQSLIEEILSEKDNFIHSKLFLVAELIAEAEVGRVIIERVSIQIEKLLEDPFCGLEAAKSLIYVNKTKAQKVLLEMLEAKDSENQILAIRTIHDMVNVVDERIIGKLIDAVDNKDSAISIWAIKTIGKLNDAVSFAALEKLIDKLGDNKYEFHQMWIIEALKELKSKVDARIVDRVLERLWSANVYEDGVLEVLVALQSKIDGRTVKKIVDKLDDGEPKDCCVAIRFFAKLQSKVDGQVFEKLVGRIEDIESKVRYCAIHAIGSLKYRVDRNTIKKIVGKLDDEDYDVRHAAVKVLGLMQDKVDCNIIETMVDRLKNDDPEVCCFAIEALGHLHDKVDHKIIEMIINKLNVDNSYITFSVISALECLGNKIDIRLVEKIFCDRTDGLYFWAIEMLGNSQGELKGATIEKLVCELENENECIRQSAINTLAKLHDKLDVAVIGKIVDRIEDEDSYVRGAVVMASVLFQNQVDDEIFNKVADKLNSNNPQVRSAAIQILRRLKNIIDYKTIERIVDAVGDSTDHVCLSALCILEELQDRVDSRIVEMLVDKRDRIDDGLQFSFNTCLLRLVKNSSEELVKKLIKMRFEFDYELFKALYQCGRLEFLTDQPLRETSQAKEEYL